MSIRWATMETNSKGTGHAWLQSPFNAAYWRSGCGMVYGAKALQDEGILRRCKQCEKCEKKLNSSSTRIDKEK